MLDIQKMTEKTREALAAAGAAARENGNQEIRPIHLLSALTHQEGGLLPSLLKRLGTPNSLLSEAVEAELAKLPNLTKLILPQSEVMKAADLLDSGLTIAVTAEQEQTEAAP